MPIPSVSFQIREYMRMRLNGTDSLAASSFNTNLLQTAATYNVPSFQLNEASSNPSLFLGKFEIASLVLAGRTTYDVLPIAVLYTAKDDMVLSTNIHSSHSLRVTPSTYSGPIYMMVDFYTQSVTDVVDGDATFHAISDAMYSTFNGQDASSLMPSGVTYNNELSCLPDVMLFEQFRWVQHIQCSLVFYRFAF